MIKTDVTTHLYYIYPDRQTKQTTTGILIRNLYFQLLLYIILERSEELLQDQTKI